MLAHPRLAAFATFSFVGGVYARLAYQRALSRNGGPLSVIVERSGGGI